MADSRRNDKQDLEDFRNLFLQAAGKNELEVFAKHIVSAACGGSSLWEAAVAKESSGWETNESLRGNEETGYIPCPVSWVSTAELYVIVDQLYPKRVLLTKVPARDTWKDELLDPARRFVSEFQVNPTDMPYDKFVKDLNEQLSAVDFPSATSIWYARVRHHGSTHTAERVAVTDQKSFEKMLEDLYADAEIYQKRYGDPSLYLAADYEAKDEPATRSGH